MVENTVLTQPLNRQLVFINAWNEWGEGAHLEPDARFGTAWLEATRDAIAGVTDSRRSPARVGDSSHAVRPGNHHGGSRAGVLRSVAADTPDKPCNRAIR